MTCAWRSVKYFQGAEGSNKGYRKVLGILIILAILLGYYVIYARGNALLHVILIHQEVPSTIVRDGHLAPSMLASWHGPCGQSFQLLALTS